MVEGESAMKTESVAEERQNFSCHAKYVLYARKVIDNMQS